MLESLDVRAAWFPDRLELMARLLLVHGHQIPMRLLHVSMPLPGRRGTTSAALCAASAATMVLVGGVPHDALPQKPEGRRCPAPRCIVSMPHGARRVGRDVSLSHARVTSGDGECLRLATQRQCLLLVDDNWSPNYVDG